MEKLKVLVVDDSLVYRRIISTAVENTGRGIIDCTASSGITALERLEQRSIDVVLLDVFMNELDGIETLKRIKERYPHITVIMISGGGEDSVQITVRALEMGAMDFILKPTGENPEENIQSISRQLGILFSQIMLDRYTSKLPEKTRIEMRNVEYKGDTKLSSASAGDEWKEKTKRLRLLGVDLVVIASSTGGPNALEQVCTRLNSDFNKPVLVVQHMPAEFTRIFAKSLTRKCSLPVKEAQDGEEIKKGTILIAPGGFHLRVAHGTERGKKIARLEDDLLVNGVRPSADVLFKSIADTYRGQRVLAIILTGMGSDGMEGVAHLKNSCQCYCITQSKETCVIYGMPRSVYEAGLSDEVLDIERIGERILEITAGKG